MEHISGSEAACLTSPCSMPNVTVIVTPFRPREPACSDSLHSCHAAISGEELEYSTQTLIPVIDVQHALSSATVLAGSRDGELC